MPFIEISELTRRIQAVEPSARLLSRWRIRRAIRRLHGLSPSASRIAHEDVYVVSADALRSLGIMEELGLTEPLPDRLILLPLPTEDESEDEGNLLREYGRRLFHAAIDCELDRQRTSDSCTVSAVDEWWYCRGGTIQHEVEQVLQSENRLLQPGDRQESFREFITLLLELHFFHPESVETYFPGLRDPSALIHEWIEKLNAQAIYQRTKLTQMQDKSESLPEPVSSKEFQFASSVGAVPDKYSRVGNDVRSAIQNVKHGNVVGAEDRLRSLVQRLRAPLHLDDAAAARWFAMLRPLLEPAAQGFWPVAGRLLYELQKACIDVERKVFAVSIVETVVSLGAHKLSREITKPREINILKRLRRAARLADKLDIPSTLREALAHRLEQAVSDAERRVRDSLRPDLEAVFTEVNLIPESSVERIAHRKLIEELLDAACACGFLTIGDIRDALSRNRLKLPDLSGPYEFITGDPLIRANRKLALRLDGVYHRGEIYMRWLQRLSSLAFGTRTGRFLTLWFILPFLCAFLLLGGCAHLVEKLDEFFGLGTRGDDLTSMPVVLGTALFILAMIQVPPFRRRIVIAARTIFHDIPVRAIRSPLVQGFFDNAVTRFLTRYLLTPLIVGGLTYLSLRLWWVDRETAGILSAGLALLTGTLFRTPWGQGLEEHFNDKLTRLWRIFSANFLLGTLTLIFRFFKTILEWMMRGLYAVDESLRFREGESSFSWGFKLVFGLVWFFISYVIRFAWNLLVEPQINPIKHFPVVTVSHKLLLPLIPDLSKTFDMNELTMGGIVAGIPGIFGFLAWELRENWNLYRANQSTTLDAVRVGSHGERMLGLLRPGFHSGIVPKTYAKLRRAEAQQNHRRAAKLHHQLDHVVDAIDHLVDRELIALLKGSQRWRKLPLKLEKVLPATNSVRIVLMIEGWQERVVICVEQREGWLIGSLLEAGWRDRLTTWQRAAFDDALIGFYKLAGVHLIREEAAALWKVDPIALDCRFEGPLLRDEKGTARYFRYTDHRSLIPTTEDGSAIPDGEVIAPGQLVFSDRPLLWEAWQQRWNEDRKGREPSGKLDNF